MEKTKQTSEKTNRVEHAASSDAYSRWNEADADKTAWPTESTLTSMSFHVLK